MLIVRGVVDDVELTGTIYEPEEQAPTFKGAPDQDAPFVWVCDEFYQVESGGQVQEIGGEDVNVAFERPMPRGFDDREAAIDGARDHILTQFARIGVPTDDVHVTIESPESTAT